MAANTARKSSAIDIESSNSGGRSRKGMQLNVRGSVGQFGDFDLDRFLEGNLEYIQGYKGESGDGGGGNILQSLTQALGLSKSAPPGAETTNPTSNDGTPPAPAKYDASLTDQQVLDSIQPLVLPQVDDPVAAAQKEDKFRPTDLFKFFGL